MRIRILLGLITLLVLVTCSGCTGAEVLTGLGILAAAWKGKQMLDHPIKAAIAENPAAFWQTILAVIGLLTAIVTVAAKAGKDHKRKERGG